MQIEQPRRLLCLSLEWLYRHHLWLVASAPAEAGSTVAVFLDPTAHRRRGYVGHRRNATTPTRLAAMAGAVLTCNSRHIKRAKSRAAFRFQSIVLGGPGARVVCVTKFDQSGRPDVHEKKASTGRERAFLNCPVRRWQHGTQQALSLLHIAHTNERSVRVQ